jgi:transcriptional regulator with XRE-family HTH domain
LQELENKSYAYQKFKELREKANLSEYQVSVGTGISTAVFTQWSRGDYNLKLDKLSLIAKFFGISVSDFIEDDEICKKESS